MTYHLLLAEPAVLFFRELDDDDQAVIWFRMKRLVNDPGQNPEPARAGNRKVRREGRGERICTA